MIGGRVVLVVVALAVCLVGFTPGVAAVLAAKQSTRTALLGSNAPSGPVLPVACNLANTTSQAILAATQAFVQANADCEAQFDACVADKTRGCDYTCTNGEASYGRTCVDFGGHYCSSSTALAGHEGSPGFKYASVECLPPSCEESQVDAVRLWMQAQVCGALDGSGCTTTLQCEFGVPTSTILFCVVGTLAAFGLCVVGAVWVLKYRSRRRNPDPHLGAHQLLENQIDDDDL